MLDHKKQTKPTLPERYQMFIERGQLNEMIRDLDVAYRQTNNESVYRVLNQLRGLSNQHEQQEASFRQEELDYVVLNLGSFPESVRSWILDYRDKELEL